ncbi:MAG TPA: hypothetical protein V6C86_11060 [Oculatellaceae cyanobacterium]
MTKMGGLKSGIKQGESTRRLDESISSSDFETSRKKPLRLARHIKSIGEQLFYVLIGVTLLFCAFRFALQTWFPGKVHQLLSPILGKNSDIIEQTLTGTPPQVADADSDTDDTKPVKDDAKTQKQSAKQNKQTKNNKQNKQKKSSQSKTITATKSAQNKPQTASKSTQFGQPSPPKTTAAPSATSSTTTTTKKPTRSRRHGRRRWRRRQRTQQKSTTQAHQT